MEIIDRLYQKAIDCLYERIDLASLHSYYMEFSDDYQGTDNKFNHELIQKFSVILDACEGTEWYYYFSSFLIYITGSNDLAQVFLKKCSNDPLVSMDYKYFIWLHFYVLGFVGILPKETPTQNLLDDLYNITIKEFEKECNDGYRFIPKSERNQDLIIVMIRQVLYMEHGPTKTLLDRSYILSKYKNKKVFIINTAEGTLERTTIPIFGMAKMNYAEEYNERDYIQYKDCVFPFYQCPKYMPQANVVHEILDVVANEKPLCIISIGTGSVVADLCSKIVPTIAISLCPSERAQTYGQFQAVGYHVTEDDYRWAQKHGKTKDHFIESVFTSAFKEQEHTYSRADLGLPQDGFIVVLVGGRLDYEVDDACLNLLIKLMEHGLYVAFMGVFDRFDSLYGKIPLFKKYAINLGFQNDALAVLECVDLYLNPKRVGGGTSVAEALYKSVPVVTMNYGDGGLGAGEDFWVTDYDEMCDIAIQYSEDSLFYEEKQKQASSRAAVLMDSEGQFAQIIQTAMEREGFD